VQWARNLTTTSESAPSQCQCVCAAAQPVSGPGHGPERGGGGERRELRVRQRPIRSLFCAGSGASIFCVVDPGIQHEPQNRAISERSDSSREKRSDSALSIHERASVLRPRSRRAGEGAQSHHWGDGLQPAARRVQAGRDCRPRRTAPRDPPCLGFEPRPIPEASRGSGPSRSCRRRAAAARAGRRRPAEVGSSSRCRRQPCLLPGRCCA
jgi:hypothetical protein